MMGRAKDDRVGIHGHRSGKMRPRQGHGRADGGHVLLAQQLADQTVVGSWLLGQMPRVGLMMRTGITGNVRSKRLLVVMKRRKKDYRKDNRQQEGG